jgi:hypothetical protein
VRFDAGGFSSKTALLSVMNMTHRLATRSFSLRLLGTLLDSPHAGDIETPSDLNFMSDSAEQIEFRFSRGRFTAIYFQWRTSCFRSDAREFMYLIAHPQTLSISAAMKK